MEKNYLLSLYEKKKKNIQDRLEDFRSLKEEDCFKEFIFCTLTPQSNAKKCWEAVEQLLKDKEILKDRVRISEVLKTKTRFHNNKSRYITENLKIWDGVKERLKKDDIKDLRNWLAEKVHGYGLKEAGHFLRNIGKSGNKIAILDRHILRNLKNIGVISSDEIKNKKDYLIIESKFLDFSQKIGIPIDELDLLFWSKENGEIFK